MQRGSLRSRLQRLERHVPRPGPPAPPIVAILDDGQWIALVNGEWVPWSPDRPVPRYCKVFAFDPRDI